MIVSKSVCCFSYLVLLPVSDLYACFPHRASSFPAANRITQRIQRFCDSAAAVAMIAAFRHASNRFKYFLVIRVCRTIVSAPDIIIIGATTYTHELAHQTNRVGLLPLGDERIFHFVSFAKKTVSWFDSKSWPRRLVAWCSVGALGSE